MFKRQGLKNTLTLLAVSVAVYALLLVLQIVGVIDEYNGRLLALSGIYLIVALSLNLVTGFTGQLALGHAGFMCVGAYSTAIGIMQFHLPMIIAIILGGIVSSIFGLVIGFPTLRLRGDYLAIATLGFGEIIRVTVINLDKLTGGASGLDGIPSFSDTGDYLIDALIRYTWVFGFAIFVIVVISNLIKSSNGRAIISVREDEIAANSMGVNTSYQKIYAFVISAFIAGLGGGLYAAFIGYLNPVMFGFLSSVNIVIIIVLGGLGSITGTIFAAIGFTYIQEWLRVFKDFRLVIFGLALIAVMLFWPSGLMGNKEISIIGILNKDSRAKHFDKIKSFISKRKRG
jgi:branched-chain amino acid transport system permease protein